MGNAAKRADRSRGGFTLTELLVAMAIFLILSSALVTLFTSAVHSVRQGYASIDASEQGRVALGTISRDLTGAFTSREFGDLYNFYGRHNGFMFVGALEDGQIGRVTYVFHPVNGGESYQTKFPIRWGDVEANIRRQTSRIYRDAGESAANVANAAQNAVDLVKLEYGVPAVANPDAIVTLNVQIDTESLIRVEERGKNDLDTFNMTITADNSVVLDFPYVDPLSRTRDAVPGNADGDAQLNFLLSALDPSPADAANDLRELYATINAAGWTHPVRLETLYLRVLGRDAFQQIINSRKREFWIRMLSGESMGVPELAPDTDPFAQNGCTGYWYDETFKAANGNARQRRILNEYVVADGIIARAVIFDATFELPLFLGFGVPIDALDADVKFTYGDGQNAPVEYFNAFENLRDPEDLDGNIAPSIPGLVWNVSGVIDNGDLVAADNKLAENLLGNRASRKNMGSPFAPRIPAVVTPQFWVTRSKRSPGAADIRRQVIQSIQVPSATGRTVETTIALGPGGTL